MPAVAAAGGTDRTATPQKVLEALHRAAAMCRARIPIVTAEVATLARSFGMLPDLERDPEPGFRALREDRLWRWVCQTGLFAPGALDPRTEHLARLRETYVWDTTASVSRHNDPVPRNVLFDGQRLWMIDWSLS